MQVSMKLEIRDTPGQLVAALMPISEAGGNIKTVIHEHDFASDKGSLGVEVVIEIPPERLSYLLTLFQERGITVIRFGEERMHYQQSVILIGHLIHTNLKDTIDRIDNTGFAEVTRMSLAMPAIHERVLLNARLKRSAGAYGPGILRYSGTYQKKRTSS
jgi:ACT domain-containing protein